MKDISALMQPKSVAIVGDTAGKGRGATIHDHLLTWGFEGPIYSVNPKYTTIRGNKCYPSLLDLPEPVEFVASAVRADLAANVLRDSGEIGAKAALFIASGFAESDDAGKSRQRELTEIAESHGIVFCGPNCYGVANLHGRFAAYSGRVGPATRKGSIALVFQSGALTHGILEPAPARRIGFSHVITTGNEASVALSDYVGYVAADPNTRVIGCFVESFRNLPDFLSAARLAIANGKHVVVLKVGRSARASRAAMAHTGALVGDDRLISAALSKAGILRVHDLDEFVEALVLLDSLQGPLSPDEYALASISGGGSGVMSDLCEDLGLRLASFGESTRTTLTGILPDFATVNNPLDITGAVGEHPGLLEQAVQVLLDDASVGTLGYALNTPSFASDEDPDTESQSSAFRHERTLAAIAAGRDSSAGGKPVVLFTMTSAAFDEELVESAAKHSLPLLQGMREGILALGRVQTAARWRVAGQRVPADRAVPDQVQALLADPRPGALSEHESKALLGAAGLALPRSVLARTVQEAVDAATRIGLPVVLKAESRDIPHKTEAGVVLLGLDSPTAVADAYRTIEERALAVLGGSSGQMLGISVQRQIPDGIDFLLGLTNDPATGPAITLGMGGIFAESIRDVATCLAPVTPAEAGLMLDELRAARSVLKGVRGFPPGDTDALIESVVRLGELAEWLSPVLAEADVNPLRVLPEGEGVIALDALFILR